MVYDGLFIFILILVFLKAPFFSILICFIVDIIVYSCSSFPLVEIFSLSSETSRR